MMKKFCFVLVASIFLMLGAGCSTTNPSRLTRLDSTVLSQIDAEDRAWMKEATKTQLDGSRVQGAGGVWIYTPDGAGHYKALWTRDFYYFVAYAGDLMDLGEVKAAITYLLDGQREDGCIPDRVNAKGVAIYSPGGEDKPMADHAVDNGSFLALLLCSYVDQSNDTEFFKRVEPQVRKGMDHIARASNGLVYNPPDDPQCVYGFSDIVTKTGHLLFSSLLYYEACSQMEHYCLHTGVGDAEAYQKQKDLIRDNISLLWDKESGMFFAADQDCRQIDLWASAYAVDVGITTKDQTDQIVSYFLEHHDANTQRGQLRHVEGGTWDRLFHECEPGTYQNGAYWATPLAWVIPVYARGDPDLAAQMLQDVIADFREHGILECVNGEYQKISNFVASATSVYSLIR